MDTATALLAAEFERISYLPEDTPMPDGFTRVCRIYMNDGAGSEGPIDNQYFGFLAESSDTAVIAIRGTETWLEWAQDARDEKAAWHSGDISGNVAKGFYDLFASSQPQPSDLSFDESTKRLIIVGHSLGAAIATLWAAEMAVYKPEVYLFAPPNVGDGAFAEDYNVSVPDTYRITTLSDIVPHLPPTIFGYATVGQEVPLLVIDNPTVSHDLATYKAAIEQGRFA